MSGVPDEHPWSDEHLGERAELYALGALDTVDVDRVNAHAARCVDCARLVGNAERTIAALDAATVPSIAPPPELGRRFAEADPVAVRSRPPELTPAPESVRSGQTPSGVAPAAASLTAVASGTPAAALAPAATYLRWAALAAGLALVVGGAAGTRGILHMQDVVAQDDAALAVVANSHFKHATLSKVDRSAPTSKVLWGLSQRWVYVIVDSPACACRIVASTAGGERDLGVPLARGHTAALFANDLPVVLRIELRRDGRTLERVELR